MNYQFHIMLINLVLIFVFIIIFVSFLKIISQIKLINYKYFLYQFRSDVNMRLLIFYILFSHFLHIIYKFISFYF